MKVLFVSVNSKYIHTLLAPRYLVANCKEKIKVYETNVNVPLNNVLADVYSYTPDVVALSVYVFNANFIRSFIKELKKILPSVKIILGGWEVSFNLDAFPEADFILKGEGDFEFSKLITNLKNGALSQRIIECGTVSNLDDIISPYSDEYTALGKDKILYIETSRGCPFSCSYCMSSKTQKVRYFSLNRVFSDIKRVTEHNPKFVKFVDRTFNCNKKRTKDILEFLIENYTDRNTCFHFEVAPELFDEELFDLIAKARKGLFQFEIGVQSYNEETLKTVGRKANLSVVDSNIKRLTDIGNSLVHVDLIAGLPHEDINSFAVGFDRLISLNPSVLQLGFLKVLKGADIINQEEYVYSDFPPYEIYSSKHLSFSDITKLKRIEEVLEIFYNSGRFNHSIRYLIKNVKSAFKLFDEMSSWFMLAGIDIKNLSYHHRCNALFSFGKTLLLNENIIEFETLIERDYEDGGNVRKWHKVP